MPRRITFLTLVTLLCTLISCDFLFDIDSDSNSKISINLKSDFGNINKVRVSRVIDGDTIEVILPDNSTDVVRMLGVDTPETRSSNKAYEYASITNLSCLKEWGEKANKYSENILEGNTVNVIYDERAGDRGYYDRLLAYIEINDYDFTESLISKGYARVYDESDFSRKDLYITKQKEAVEKKMGLWGACQSN
jgi:micrococcal nuclease